MKIDVDTRHLPSSDRLRDKDGRLLDRDVLASLIANHDTYHLLPSYAGLGGAEPCSGTNEFYVIDSLEFETGGVQLIEVGPTTSGLGLVGIAWAANSNVASEVPMLPSILTLLLLVASLNARLTTRRAANSELI